MDYDLGFFDEEPKKVDPAENPFMAKLLPMCPVWTGNKWWAWKDYSLR